MTTSSLEIDVAPAAAGLRVCVAHEWLVAYGGSERVVEEILRIFPDSPVLTTLVDPAAVPAPLSGAVPSILQRLPGATRHHEWTLPLMPLAWRLQETPRDIDIVVSSSHACAKAVPLPPGVPHLCYCHTPMRYAWDFEGERTRFPRAIRPLARSGAAWLRGWDRRSTSRRVTRFVANSSAVASRIERSYGRTAEVIHPPVRTDFFTPGGERDDFFLYVGRLVGYKRPELVVDAFAGLPYRLVVVGDGQLAPALRRRAPSNVTHIPRVNDETLRDLYRSARALVFPAEEDFGITMAEAQACGTPVIGAAAGGATDIVRPGTTGWLLERPEVTGLQALVARAANDDLDPEAIRANAERFSPSRFRERLHAAVQAVVDDNRPRSR